ncbi:hypothetical protein L195_g064135, partial [Trifolium pratense]
DVRRGLSSVQKICRSHNISVMKNSSPQLKCLQETGLTVIL